MPRRRCRAGRGAVARCLARFLHPSSHIREKYPNTYKKERISGLIVIRREERAVRRGSRPTRSLVMSHAEFADVEFYAAERNVIIDTEGPEDGIFDTPPSAMVDGATAVTGAEAVGRTSGETDALELPPVPSGRAVNFTTDDLAALQRQGIQVDDDNAPAPENIPVPTEEPMEEAGGWGFDGLDQWRARGCALRSKPRFKNVSTSRLQHMTSLDIFLLLFPVDYIKDTVIPETNKHLRLGPTTFSEFIAWLGLWQCEW